MWKTLDQVETPPVYLRAENLEVCYFARDYISHGGYSASEANSLIVNFKKGINRKGTNEWLYRNRAVRQFAQELDGLPSDIAVAAVPSSALVNDADYNCRFEDLFAILEERRSSRSERLVVEWPFRRRRRVSSYHRGSRRRLVEDVYDSLEWVGLRSTPDRLAIIDDVVTCGTHFKACQRLVMENAPGVKVYGFFWARTVWEDQSGAVPPLSTSA